MSDVRITTNNVPRDVVDACMLTDAERAEFDYLDWPAIDEGRDSASFFRYQGQVYDLGTFTRIPPGAGSAMAGWHGGHADSYFSGILVKLSSDGESVIVGRYVS